jgi:DNA-binding HxlR family transcriptional regulator
VVYDRARWERAVLDVPSHQSDKLVALVLAHFAGPGGLLPAGGIQHTPRLVPLTGLSSRTLRQAMRNLERDGLIWRPRIEKGTQDHTARPITLTMPPAHTRTEPPHTGQRP